MASIKNDKMNVSRERNINNTRNAPEAVLTNTETDAATISEGKSKKKITIVVDEDDPCLKKDDEGGEQPYTFVGADPRFQQQNQSLRCWVMYTDFYRCERILGEGTSACTWFKHAFTTMCPNDWIRHWDDLRVQGKFPWHKYKTQGDFPGDKYGV